MNPVVLKFGGTSVGDAGAITRLGDIVTRETRPRLVVVSALGGVTDQLAGLAALARGGDAAGARARVEQLRERHARLAHEVAVEPERSLFTARLDAACADLAALAGAVSVLTELSPRAADAIAAYGELLSSDLVTAALRSREVDATWIDARRVLVTDDAHGRAQPDLAATAVALGTRVAPEIARQRVPVVGGYIGSTAAGVTTTLGRGGSDYSASLFGAALGASDIQIWTDVDGMMTADPRIIPDARLVPELSFAEAAELAYFGAKVLHPASIQPAVTSGIPVRILNARRPDGTGTLVSAAARPRAGAIAALASKRAVTVIEITSARMLMAHGFLRRLFEVFDRLEIAVDVVTTSEVNVSVTIDESSHLEPLVAALGQFAEVRVEPEMALLCVVGDTLHEDAELFGRIVGALGSIPCRMVSQSASRRNVTFVLRERDLSAAMRRLHDRFFPAPPQGRADV